MYRNHDWQEVGLRISGELLDAQDARLLVDALPCGVKDPQILGEIENFLIKDRPLSEKTRQALLLKSNYQ